MASDLFNSINQFNPNAFMQSLTELKNKGGDPNQMIQQMLNSGRISQAQYNAAVNGEPRLTSRAIFTPAAVEDYGNVTSTAIIKVPRCCCFSLSVDAVPATTDPTVTPAPVIEVQNANLTITRIA